MVLAVLARGAEVGPDVEEGVGAGVGAPAAANLLLELTIRTSRSAWLLSLF